MACFWPVWGLPDLADWRIECRNRLNSDIVSVAIPADRRRLLAPSDSSRGDVLFLGVLLSGVGARSAFRIRPI